MKDDSGISASNLDERGVHQELEKDQFEIPFWAWPVIFVFLVTFMFTDKWYGPVTASLQALI